jgi:hypothetical protein
MVLKDNFVIYDLTVYNVPSNAKYFIAAFIKDDVEIPFVSEEIVDTYYFEFLSNPAKLLIGEKVSSPDEVLSLQGYAFNYLIAEDIVLYNILTNKRNEKYPSWPKQWSQNNWEWHTDVGYTNFLSPNSIIQNKQIMTMPLCEKLYLFQSTTLQIPVYDLHEDTVYKSTFHNMKIGEFVTVNHTQKIVTFYQVTNRNLKDHPFKLKTIYDAMNDLSMFAEAGLKYTLRLLCFVDSTVSNPRGIAFENNNDIEISLKDFKKDKSKDGFTKLKSRITTNIVRIIVFPKATNILISRKTTKSYGNLKKQELQDLCNNRSIAFDTKSNKIVLIEL